MRQAEEDWIPGLGMHDAANEEVEDNWRERYKGYRDWRFRHRPEKSLADFPDDQVRDENGCFVWLRDHVDYR